ncbi:MAG: hypothetical protein ACJAWM_001634 [Sulfitobacter sp.]|jgi:hypothetical protein
MAFLAAGLRGTARNRMPETPVKQAFVKDF